MGKMRYGLWRNCSAAIIIGAAITSSNILATLLWVENRTEKLISVKFLKQDFSVDKDHNRVVDNVFGLKLPSFKINDHEIKVPEKLQKGLFWYLCVEPRPFNLTKFSLYRIDANELRKDIYKTIDVAAVLIRDFAEKGLKNKLEVAKKILNCVMTGIIDNQGQIYLTYDEKYIANLTSSAITVQMTTIDNKKFDHEIKGQKCQIFDTIVPIAGITLESTDYGKFDIGGDALKNEKYFVVLNGKPYQVATFSDKNFDSIALFNLMESKLAKYMKENPREARSIDIIYFINDTPKPITIEIKVMDHKPQKISIPAHNVDYITALSKITSLELNDGETKATVDSANVAKFNGFYISNLKEKNGVLHIGMEATEYKFPVSNLLLWWKATPMCENTAIESAKK